MKKSRKLSLWKADAWKLCSEYIRRKYSNPDGFASCVCCGVSKHWKKLQAGHLVPSRRLGILFDERGIFPCCYGCNIMKGGNIHEYVAYMRTEFGKEYTDNLIEELRHNAKQVVKFTVEDYKKLIEEYERKIQEEIIDREVIELLPA